MSEVEANLSEATNQVINGLDELEFTPEELTKKLEQDLQKRSIENEILKSRVQGLEKELKKYKEQCEAGGSSNPPGPAENTQKNDGLLLKAKELLFEKTKIGKRQEQQIAALEIQVQSVKDVLEVTKDMLEIRNVENKHLQAKIDTVDLRLKAEKERQLLFEKKLQISQKMYADLRKEYETQSEIFKELRGSYEMKNRLLTAELEKLQRP